MPDQSDFLTVQQVFAWCRMPDADRYRAWKAAKLLEATSPAPVAASSRGRKWFCCILLFGLAVAAFAFTSMPVQPAQMAALNELKADGWLGPVQLVSSYIPVMHPSHSMPEANLTAATDILLPGMNQKVTTDIVQTLERTEMPDTSAPLSTQRLQPMSQLANSTHQHSLQQSKALSPTPDAQDPGINWSLENSLLRAAELDCELANMRDQNQQLCAHVLSASRQLAAIGLPVQPPQHDSLPSSRRGLMPSSRIAVITSLLAVLLVCFYLAGWTWQRSSRKLVKSAAAEPDSVQQVRAS